MGQLGIQELILIFVVALLVFGPKKLPELGKSLGKGLREFRRATNDLKATWEDQVRDTEAELADTKRDLRNLNRDIHRDLKEDPPTPPRPAGAAEPPATGGSDGSPAARPAGSHAEAPPPSQAENSKDSKLPSEEPSEKQS